MKSKSSLKTWTLASLTALVALAYVAVPVLADAQQTSVMGKGADGMPRPIGATSSTVVGGNRLRLESVSAETPNNASDQCVSTVLPASGKPDGGTYSVTLSADTWQTLEVIGDGNGWWLGCWSYTRLTTTPDGGNPCFAFPGLKDGQEKILSFSEAVPGVDAGALNGRAVVYLWGNVAGMQVKLCPSAASTKVR